MTESENYGTIIKGIGSFYSVYCEEKQCIFVCKPRGRFRNEHSVPTVGDKVVFSVCENNDSENSFNGYLQKILPRKNLLTRPAVANIDKLLIVISALLPATDYYLVDKLILNCFINNIVPILIVNKCDLVSEETKKAFISGFTNTNIRILLLSAKTGEGISDLKQEMQNNTSCFAGQSAVGKSSLVNAIMPKLSIATGGLSRKTDRGRHTTRTVELIKVDSVENAFVLDTPGFSLLDLPDIAPNELSKLYPEMKAIDNSCRFAGCLHVSEPDCAIKAVVGTAISKERYNRYVQTVSELSEKYKHRF